MSQSVKGSLPKLFSSSLFPYLSHHEANSIIQLRFGPMMNLQIMLFCLFNFLCKHYIWSLTASTILLNISLRTIFKSEVDSREIDSRLYLID